MIFDFKILKAFLKMLGSCKCMFWNRIADHVQPGPEPFSLPDPIPTWPEGTGFATSPINLGELDVRQITKFESIWGCNLDGKNGFSFYKPLEIPDGYFTLGHYCQCNAKPLQGSVLVAHESSANRLDNADHKPALSSPVDYTLVWSSHDGSDESFGACGYFWLPQPPEGYKALGFVVTNNPEKPFVDEVKCVRIDLTDSCEAHHVIVSTRSDFFKVPITVWNTRPLHRGMYGRGVSVGTFYCSSSHNRSGEELDIACLKNLDPNLHAMPILDQIHAVIRHYGPMLFFHPNEVYLPSSVSWFFENGALLFSKTNSSGEAIDSEGSNLPIGGTNDGKYWIDLPSNNQRDHVKHGNIESSKLYVHVKPALGGTFTDVVMWVFCPFNGPGTLKVGMMNIGLGKVGQHVGDWEHFTLRISNFTGELRSVYFSQHSGGEWIDVFDLEFIEGNKTVVYSSRNGHASFPRPGNYLQGSPKLGIGVRNDAARSKFYVDSSTRYEIIAAEYLGDVVKEPVWLQFMREWGPTVVYDSRAELERVIKYLPMVLRCSVENAFNKLPFELYGEEGPTGPKEKNNWIGDERC